MSSGLHSRYPLFLPCLGFCAGLILASSCPWVGQYYFYVLFVGILLGLGLLLFWRRRSPRLFLLTCCFLILGWLRLGDHFFKAVPQPMRGWIQNKEIKDVLIQAEDYCLSNGEHSYFPGRVLGFFEEGRVFSLDVPVRMTVGSAMCPAAPKLRFRTWAKFGTARAFRNPASFDFPRYFRGKGFLATGFIRTAEEMRSWDPPPAWIYREANVVRDKIRLVLAAGIPDPEARGILAAMLLRETKDLGVDWEERFRRAGLTHLLVVSGLNFSLTLFVFYYPLYLFFSFHFVLSNSGRAKKFAMAFALIPTLFYALMVGLTPSVLRALSMAMAMVFALLVNWKKDFFSLLLLTLAIILLWQPLLLFDLSFQLSFLSVTAIYIFSLQCQRVLNRLGEKHRIFEQRWLRYVLTLFASSVAVNLALFPLLAGTFHEVSLIAPLANLFFVPLFSILLLPGGTFAAMLGIISPSLGHKLFFCLGFLTQKALILVRILSDLPFSSFLASSLHGIVLLAYLLFLVGLFQLANPRRLLACCLIAALLLGGERGYALLYPRESLLRLTLLDVGQGDGMILTLPEGDAMVIDGGGFPFSDFDVGKNVMAPELLRLGERGLSALVMTHPDADHYKGLYFLAKRWKTQEFWLSPSSVEHRDFAGLKALLQNKNIPLRKLSRGQSFSRGGADFQVLWPPAEGEANFLKDNDQCLVLRVCYREVCFLLTGDIEKNVEEALLQQDIKTKGAILKVAHHGSSTSSSSGFLKQVAPRLALISVGRDNRFGFPKAEVLERLRREHAVVLRTDQDGQIEVFTDGRNIFYETYLGLKGTLSLTGSPFPSLWSATQGVIFGGKS